MEKSYTPISLWRDFDPESTPLNSRLIRQDNVDGIKVGFYTFCGDKKDKQSTRVLAGVAYKHEKKKMPVIIIVNPFERINDDLLVTWAKMGYLAISIDYLGESERHPGNMTVYPECLSFANFDQAKDNLTNVYGDAKHTCWYQWTLNTRRAVTFAKSFENADIENIGIYSIREGNIIVLQTLATDSRIKAGAVMYGNLWENVEQEIQTDNDITDPKTLQAKTDLLQNNVEWLAAISPQSYLSYIKQPFFTCIGTNSPSTDMDRTYDCLSRMSNIGQGMVLFAPKAMNSLLSQYERNLEKWFSVQLMPSENKFDMREIDIKITAEYRYGKVEIVSQYEGPHYQSANIYYCRDKMQLSGTRNWIQQSMEKRDGGGLAAQLRLFNKQTPIIAFCNITFRNGVTVSSNLLKFIPEKKFENRPLITERKTSIVYTGDDGIGDFTPMTHDGTQKGRFVDEHLLSAAKGPFGIVGLRGTKMGTFAVGDDSMMINSNSLLMFDVYSKKAQTLDVYFVIDWGKDSCTVFKHACLLDGGENWQKISLAQNEFKDETGSKGLNFSDSCVLCFECDQEVIVNNVLFT